MANERGFERRHHGDRDDVRRFAVFVHDAADQRVRTERYHDRWRLHAECELLDQYLHGDRADVRRAGDNNDRPKLRWFLLPVDAKLR